MRLVEVEWEDAYNGNHLWTKLAEGETFDECPMIIRTVGYIVQEGRERIKLAMSQAAHPEGERSLCDLFTIPRGCIIAIREIKCG